MAKYQSMTSQPQHKEGDNYGGIEAGASLFPTGSDIQLMFV